MKGVTRNSNMSPAGQRVARRLASELEVLERDLIRNGAVGVRTPRSSPISKTFANRAAARTSAPAVPAGPPAPLFQKPRSKYGDKPRASTAAPERELRSETRSLERTQL